MSDDAVAAPTAWHGWTMAAGRFFVIAMVLCLGGLVLSSIRVVLVHISAHFGLDIQVAETLYDLPMLTIATGAPLGGFIADRFGYRITLLTSLGLYCLITLAEQLAGGFMFLLASRLVLGLAGGSLMAIFLALVAAWYRGIGRTMALGLAFASSTAISVSVLTLAGSLAWDFTWRLPFFLYLLMGLVTLAVVGLVVRGPFRGSAAPSAPGAIVALGGLWQIYLVLFLLWAGASASESEEWGLLTGGGRMIIDPPTPIQVAAAGATAASILTALAYGLVARWVNERALLVMTAIWMGLGVFAAELPQTRSESAVAIIILKLGTGLLAPVAASIVLARAPEALRATVAGLSFSCLMLGQFLGPIAVEMLNLHVEIPAVFLIVGCVLLAVAVFAWVAGVGKVELAKGAAR